ALCRMVTGLIGMLSPVLAFTADEAWTFVPGKTVESAHELNWKPCRFEREAAEASAWKTLFELRELALPELEKARQAKTIGKALEAKLILAGADPRLAVARNELEALRELLNVSQLEVLEGGDGIAIQVIKAAGEKCERCWHWETDVGSNSE